MTEKPATENTKSPVKGGWRGNLSGGIEGTSNSHISASEITLKLDRETAWALANLLHDNALERSCNYGVIEGPQEQALSNLGAALGRLIDHGAANNGGREVLK